MARDNELSSTERVFFERIDALVQERASVARKEAELSNEIAALAVEARAANVPMAMLGEWIRVFDSKKGEEGELRPISRQAVDQLVAKHQGRPRPQTRRRKPAQTNNNGTRIEMSVFE